MVPSVTAVEARLNAPPSRLISKKVFTQRWSLIQMSDVSMGDHLWVKTFSKINLLGGAFSLASTPVTNDIVS